MDILKPIENSINIPIDDDLLNVLMTKINNLKQENEHLKYTIRYIQDKQTCVFSTNKEPKTIDHLVLVPALRLACYCQVESIHHKQHVICKIMGNDEFQTKTFAYYISEDASNNVSLSIMMEILLRLHKELINKMIEDYEKEINKE